MVGLVWRGVVFRIARETAWWWWWWRRLGPEEGRGLKGDLIGNVAVVEGVVSSSSWMGGTVISNGNEGLLDPAPAYGGLFVTPPVPRGEISAMVGMEPERE